MKKIRLYCKCGASWKGTVTPDGAFAILAEWRCTHQGAGHGDCDVKTAARARDASERAAHYKDFIVPAGLTGA